MMFQNLEQILFRMPDSMLDTFLLYFLMRHVRALTELPASHLLDVKVK